MAWDRREWGWATKPGVTEYVEYEINYIETINNQARFQFKAILDSGNSNGDTGEITWTVSDRWNSQRLTGSRGNMHTTGGGQRQVIVDTTFGIMYDGDGTMGGNLFVDFTVTMTRALPTWGATPYSSLREKVPANGNPMGILKYVDMAWNPNDGIVCEAVVGQINGNYTHWLEIFKRDGSAKLIEKKVEVNKRFRVTFTEDEITQLYNELSSTNGNKLKIHLATWYQGIYQGGDSETNSVCKPKLVTYTAPTTGIIGTNISLNITPTFKGVDLEMGLAKGGVWLGGWPVKNKPGSSAAKVHTLNLQQAANVKSVRASYPDLNSYALQIYVRQINSRGEDLGAVIKNITIADLAPSISKNPIDRTPTRFRSYLHLSYWGTIVEIDRSIDNNAKVNVPLTIDTDPDGSKFYTDSAEGLNPGSSFKLKYFVRFDGSNVYHQLPDRDVILFKLTTLTISPDQIRFKTGETFNVTVAYDGANSVTLGTYFYGDVTYDIISGGSKTIPKRFDLPAGVVSTTARFVVDSIYPAFPGALDSEKVTATVTIYEDGDLYLMVDGKWVTAEVFIQIEAANEPTVIYYMSGGKWVQALM